MVETRGTAGGGVPCFQVVHVECGNKEDLKSKALIFRKHVLAGSMIHQGE